MKKITLLIILLLTFSFGYGQTTLAKEDIAIIGVNTDNEDFTFLLRTDITTGTQIYFSDNEVNAAGTGLLDTNEGLVLFTALSDYSCGTVLGFIANSSEFTVIDNTFALANGGDEVLAFQGYNAITDEWTTFLHANVDATLTNLPIGFTSSDIVDGTQDNREYNGSTANPSWTDLNSIANYDQANDYSSVTLSTAAFACVACSLTVTWNGTWSGTPSSSTEVVIEANYRTGNSVNEINFSACSLTINNGAILTIDNGGYVEVENDVLVNDGAIRVESQGNFVQNDNSGSFTLGVSGTAIVHKVTPAKQDWLHYTYWSSPVENWTIADAFPFTPADRRFWFNASNYLDEHTVDTSNGIPDDIDDNNDAWQYTSGTDVMLPGVGYAATAGPFHTPGGTDTADFIGVFNTGDITTAIAHNPLNVFPAFSWNFIGNPYPSAIDFIAFQAANSTVIDGAAYFWSQASPPSSANPGNQVQNFDLNDYAVYTVGSGGVAGGTPDEPTQYIPSAQGFFVAGLSNGSVTFTNSIRMADGTSNTLFFKNANSKKNAGAVANKLWVNLTSDNGVFNQILVSYVDGATKGNDGMSYDAPKFLSNTVAVLYTSMENSDKKFAIQGKAPSDLNENEIIDLGFKTAIDVETLYTFSIAQFQGAFLNNNPVFLIDNLLNKTHDLKVCDYSFTSEVGEFNNRFQIAFSDKALSTNAMGLNDNALKIIELANDHVNFKLSDNLKIKSVTIFDLLGRPLYNLKGANSSETYQLSKLKNTVYIAKVELSNGAIITKKAIKQ